VPTKSQVDESIIGSSNSQKVREQVKSVFEGELSETVTQSVNRVLTDYIVKPYEQICEDYIERSQLEQHIFFDRVDMLIKTTE